MGLLEQTQTLQPLDNRLFTVSIHVENYGLNVKAAVDLAFSFSKY
jgi:hypothetical protein